MSSTTFVNLMDQTFGIPIVDGQPSVVCPARYSAMGTGTTVPIAVQFRAAVDNGAGGAPASTAELRIEALQSGINANVTVTGATAATYTATGTISTNLAYDKIGLYGRVLNAADRLRVWVWSVYEEGPL